MTNEAIIKHVEGKDQLEKPLKIQFKQRSTMTGLFVRGHDYEDLRSKNFWRIVSNANIEIWKKTKDPSLVRIFNGAEFTKLSAVN